MNDVEHDLRELLDRKAGSVGTVAPRLPDGVRARSRRRQLGTALVSGVAVAALVVGSVGALRRLTGATDNPPRRRPMGGLQGLRTHSDDRDSRSRARATGTWSTSGPWEPARHDAIERTGIVECILFHPRPVPLVISAFTSASVLPLPRRRAPSKADEAVLEVAIDAAASRRASRRARAARLPAWPVGSTRAVANGHCGQGHYTASRSEITPIVASPGSATRPMSGIAAH